MEIKDPNKWRISKSGFSIVTGWSDDRTYIARYPGATYPLDSEAFQDWMRTAQQICDTHNGLIELGPLEGDECLWQRVLEILKRRQKAQTKSFAALHENHLENLSNIDFLIKENKRLRKQVRELGGAGPWQQIQMAESIGGGSSN